jgi:hypothetical protein
VSFLKTPIEPERHKDDIADETGSRQADRIGGIIFFGLNLLERKESEAYL